MAKCIQIVGQGIPVRMSDADAFQVVERDHDGEYCSKNVFKKAYMPTEQGGEPREQLRAKLEHGKIVATSTLHYNAQHKKGGYL
jgi:hypothetical protein